MKMFELIVTGLLLCFLVFGVMTIISYLPMGSSVYAQYEGNISLLPKVGAVQFYSNMRYESSTITYSVENACSLEKTIDIKKALQIISDKTILKFIRVSDNGQIVYLCSLPEPTAEQKGHFIAGEGGPVSIINTTSFSLINSGQVALYRDERCTTPNVAIHETLHALGFDHVQDRSDIMYPVTDCNKEIKPALIAAINKLYSYPSQPDLGIETLIVNQSGRFLDFHIAIGNHGLSSATEANLTLMTESKVIRSFDIGPISTGMRKILDVQNLLISSKSVKITFIVKSTVGQEDMFLADNEVEITLK
jgi:hypothetical protein